jgi:MFS transporter, SP family, general alpha glucoside:H+ symporter
LDLLFERKVSARNFASTDVDVFDETVESGKIEKYQHDIVEKMEHDKELSEKA